MLPLLLAALALQEPVAPPPPAEELAAMRAAAAYSRERGGVALLVRKHGQVVFEDYADWYGPDKALHIGGATQAFWALATLAAAEDGLLELDERVCETVKAWQRVAGKESVTIRHLLQQSSGLEANARRVRDPGTIDFQAAALALDLLSLPGDGFRPGPGHWWVLGAVLEGKLADRGEDPLAYLRRRVLDPLGLEVYHWDRDRTGRATLPWGATLTARAWSDLGQLVLDRGRVGERQLIAAERIAECLQPSAVTPSYGMGFWLFEGLRGLQEEDPEDAGRATPLPEDAADALAALPRDVVFSAGGARQRLYVLRSRGLVVVRQALPGASWSDVDFLRLLLGLERPDEAPAAPGGGAGGR